MISPKICHCIHPFFGNYAPVSTPSSYCIGYSVIKDTVSSYVTKYTMCNGLFQPGWCGKTVGRQRSNAAHTWWQIRRMLTRHTWCHYSVLKLVDFLPLPILLQKLGSCKSWFGLRAKLGLAVLSGISRRFPGQPHSQPTFKAVSLYSIHFIPTPKVVSGFPSGQKNI